MSDIDDPVSIGAALDMIIDRDRRQREGRDAPMAMCPRCIAEPLVSTLERPGAEFHCVVCGGWFGFLAPRPAEVTPEIEARLAVNQARYDAERAGADR